MVHDYSFFGSTADFVIKKEHLRFYRIWPSPTSETSGRNMTVELDSRCPIVVFPPSHFPPPPEN